LRETGLPRAGTRRVDGRGETQRSYGHCTGIGGGGLHVASSGGGQFTSAYQLHVPSGFLLTVPPDFGAGFNPLPVAVAVEGGSAVCGIGGLFVSVTSCGVLGSGSGVQASANAVEVTTKDAARVARCRLRAMGGG
jgi:hypothetical protein